MSQVINGNYDFSLARWFYTPERQKILDFVDIGADRGVLALHKESLTFDMNMLIKPFTKNVWFIILISTLTVFSLQAIFMYFGKIGAQKVLKFATLISFVFLHAYYAGAMTMFFTSKPTLSFTTLRDVLKAVPEWKLVFLKGMDVHFEEPVSKVRFRNFR